VLCNAKVLTIIVIVEIRRNELKGIIQRNWLPHLQVRHWIATFHSDHAVAIARDTKTLVGQLQHHASVRVNGLKVNAQVLAAFAHPQLIAFVAMRGFGAVPLVRKLGKV